MNKLTVENWLSRGYRKFPLSSTNKEINKYADFIVQREVYDEAGIRYFITVYCYDRKNYPSDYRLNLPEFGFMATVNFNLGSDKPFFNIDMNSFNNINQVEDYFDLFWHSLEKPYYKRLNRESA